MASYPLIGKKTVYIDDMIIPPDYIQDEVGTITLTPSTTEIASQSGTIKVPNGSYDELSFELNIICPSVRFLGMLFPELYHNASFKRVISGTMSETGQVRFGGNECVSNTPRDIIIHNVCDGQSSAQDFRIPNALISAGGEFKVSLSDPFIVTLTGTMASGSEGAVIMGELDLTTPSHYDETTGSIKPDESKITGLKATPSTIAGKINSTVKINVTASPNGAVGDITATVDTEGLAKATDNGDGTWNVTLNKAGTGTVTFKSGSVQTVINVNATA
ncbi:MAG: hypothetical protein [Namikivirus tsukuho]|uniref:Bacterial Ig domain-containing protein n=1 Tax=Bacteriophage sp. TaxID=38018 RepID=A0ABY5TVQ3_9VIRU|nr:MAG: hypothetical protein [Bacteriophage sp.]